MMGPRLRASPRRVALLLATALVLSGCKAELYSDLSEREANQIVAALMEIGIPASKEAGRADGVTVMVEQSRFAEAISLLNARGLPSAQYESFGDVFQKEGLVSSPVEERARYIYALSQELSRTVAEIDGVLSARIHVVLPESDMLGRNLQPSSASVFIRHSPDAPVTDFTAQIKQLVANSIEGLVYDNVTVVAVPAAPETIPERQPPVLRSIAGIWVHPASAQRLLTTIGLLATLAVAGAGAALGTVLLGRRRAAEAADFAEADHAR